MTTIAKTTRVALAVALLALATAASASADAFRPADVYHPAAHVGPGATRAWDYSRPTTGRGWSHIVRVVPNFGCATHPCMD